VHCLSCSSLYYTVINSYVLTCSVCQPEYYLNATLCSSCSEVIPFCLTCQNSYQCVSCDYGYYLSSVLSCVSCIEVMPGCQLCTSGSLCSQCTEGYYLINNYCTLCNMALNHCFHCQYTGNTTLFCSTCEEGYYLGADYVCRACSAALNLCTKCSNSQVCLACITGYTPDLGGTCSQCSVVVPNCDYCTL
jgi:proprotein convertase subtilisin/kexin type 5